MADLNFTVTAGRKLRLSSSSSSSSDDEQIVMHTPMLETASFVVTPSVDLSARVMDDAIVDTHARAVSSMDDDAAAPIGTLSKAPVLFEAGDVRTFPSSFAVALTTPPSASGTQRIDASLLRKIEQSLRAEFSFAKFANAFKFNTPPPIELRKEAQIMHSHFS